MNLKEKEPFEYMLFVLTPVKILPFMLFYELILLKIFSQKLISYVFQGLGGL